ncbi:MAG TPA: Asp23/Gls24 family envelope stress response protein [Gaiellaceae bacterium]|nr:Asp23/Gls24 family envelope stress response protein [Gaiellaceae bacterium]
MTLVVSEDGGAVTITDAALAQIVVQAAEAVEGARVRRQRRRLEIAVADGHASVELELAVAYGRVLPDVAREVQRRVADALTRMCGLDVDAVDVAVEELDR